jgi:hypothetical protein
VSKKKKTLLIRLKKKSRAPRLTPKSPASTGNVCTVRCRNNALAGPFGGCFPVQQAGAKAKTNVANKITTAQTLDGVQKQVEQNKQDLAAAVAANQQEGSAAGKAAAAEVKKVLNQADPVIKAAPVQTPALAQPGAAAAGQNNNNNGQGNKNGGNGGGKKNGGNGNGAGANGNAAAQGNGRQRGGNNNNNNNNNQNNKRAFGNWVDRQLANLRQ